MITNCGHPHTAKKRGKCELCESYENKQQYIKELEAKLQAAQERINPLWESLCNDLIKRIMEETYIKGRESADIRLSLESIINAAKATQERERKLEQELAEKMEELNCQDSKLDEIKLEYAEKLQATQEREKKLRKACQAALDWATSDIDLGGDISDLAEGVVPKLDEALQQHEGGGD